MILRKAKFNLSRKHIVISCMQVTAYRENILYSLPEKALLFKPSLQPTNWLLMFTIQKKTIKGENKRSK